jgi:hypothetical protein
MTESRRASISNGESESSSKFSFKSFSKGFFLASLPHFTLILIFFVYVIVGSAILWEIEKKSIEISSIGRGSEEPHKLGPGPIPKHGFNSKNTDKKIKTVSIKLSDTSSFKKFESQFGEIKKTYLTLNAGYFKTLAQIKQSQEQIVFNHNEFLKDCQKLVKQAFNNSAVSFNSTKKANNTDSKFMSDLYEKQKKNVSAVNIFKSVAKYLTEFKSQTKSEISKSLKNLVESYVKKEAAIKKTYSDLWLEQEAILKQNEKFLNAIKMDGFDLDEKIVVQLNDKTPKTGKDQEEEDDDEKEAFSKKEKINWNFSTSAYFIGSLLTTIGDVTF